MVGLGVAAFVLTAATLGPRPVPMTGIRYRP